MSVVKPAARQRQPMPPGFYPLIGAQFFSGLADNALMILGIYFLQEKGHPGWWVPLLKFSFTLAYVLMAPVMGPLADAFSKPRVMACMNGLKMLGLLLLLAGVHPLLCFALMGLAASAYAPAKYGLMTESVTAAQLIRANAWLEVSVVLSVVLGTALGGALLAASLHGPLNAWVPERLANLSAVVGGFAGVLAAYLLASALNLGLRPGQFTRAYTPLSWRAASWPHFWRGQRMLWRDPLGRVSLYVTTLYWGVGAVLPFAVLLWAQRSLHLPLQQGAYLQACVAVGVMAGAASAARLFQLHQARRAVPVGWLLVLLLPVMAWVDTLWLGLPLLMLAGAVGGLLLVPMNGLLQYRGLRLLSAGRSVAVQGFNENLSVLIMLGAYSAMLGADWPLWAIMVCLALVLGVGTAPLCWPLKKFKRPSHRANARSTP